MKISLSMLFFVFLILGCKKKEDNSSNQPNYIIQVPSKSANVVFHIKDNKMTSYEIINEDGSPLKESVVYRELNNKDGKEVCYKCLPGETDLKKCTIINCPKDPCKEIYCGPLNFGIFDQGSTTPNKIIQYSVVTGDIQY